MKNRRIVDGMSLELHLERLLVYGIQAELIDREDYLVVRNSLFELFDVVAPTSERAYRRGPYLTLEEVLPGVVECGCSIGLCENEPYAKEQFAAKVMGYLTPRQSEVYNRFYELYEQAPEKATDYVFELSKKTGYIRESNNIKWTYHTEFGDIDMTVNLSKPEKDPRDIERDLNAGSKGLYPKCVLCPQTAGFAGKPGFPNRQNHRVVRLKDLGGHRRDWYFQFSPYQYYNEHCIVIYENHIPMKTEERTFETLFDFVDRFPHYFIGSNADLPIVGGSLLSHDHFQGGRHAFPMERAKAVARLEDENGVRAFVVNWPVSTVRLRSKNREHLVSAAMNILSGWHEYENAELGILPYTKVVKEIEVSPLVLQRHGPKVETTVFRHNAVTPILRRKANYYELDLALRNNRTNEEFPLGIFHARPEDWHIKKENLGLIEVMGLAILPGRLGEEMKLMAEVLTGRADCGAPGFYRENGSLEKHRQWLEFLLGKYGNRNSDMKTDDIIKLEMGIKFRKILEDCGVFKNNFEGFLQFCEFLEGVGFVREAVL